ncbi:MAG: amidohydrolase family protein, partial [Armatimonadota bacterium]
FPHAGHYFGDASQLLAEMDYYGIEDALVSDSLSREHHPSAGNARIMSGLADQPRLHPCWSLLPQQTGELWPPGYYVDQMLSSGVRAVRLFPVMHRFCVREWAMGEVYAALEARRIPLFLDFDDDAPGSDRADWDAVVEVCRSHPRLPVIVSEWRLRQNRKAYQALSACPNLRLDVSGFWHYRGIEDICARFGAERLLFGTRMPYRDPGCALAMVTYADITEQQRRLVAGDNLRRLLGI